MERDAKGVNRVVDWVKILKRQFWKEESLHEVCMIVQLTGLVQGEDHCDMDKKGGGILEGEKHED